MTIDAPTLALAAAAAVAAVVCACLVLAVALNANKQLTTATSCCGLLLATAFGSLVLSAALDKPWLLTTAVLVASCCALSTAATICMRATQVRCMSPFEEQEVRIIYRQ